MLSKCNLFYISPVLCYNGVRGGENMYFEDIPFYTAFSEVETCVARSVLAASDSAEFLGGEGYGLSDIYDLYGTKYEDIIPAFVSSGVGESWGMRGTLFRFKLTDALKRHILEESLTCMFGEANRIYLENLTLFAGAKTVFSCVSHEFFSLYHMAEADDSLAGQILSDVEMTIKNMPLYNQMRDIAANLHGKTREELEKELRILSDLCWYVDNEKGCFVQAQTKYECDFQAFKKIAKNYLTEELYAALSPLDCFSELQPQPVAKTVDDVLNGVGKQPPQYLHSEFYLTIKRQVNMLKFILGI